jgi:hypothetical protein
MTHTPPCALQGQHIYFYAFPVRETISIEKQVPPVSYSPSGGIISIAMNALTGNKTALRIFRSMDMNALTGKAQNHPARSIQSRFIQMDCAGKYAAPAGRRVRRASFHTRGVATGLGYGGLSAFVK